MMTEAAPTAQPAWPRIDDWRAPPERLALDPGALHLWRIDLPSPGTPPPDPGHLSLDERRRAEDLARPPGRAAFVHTRTALRRILAGYLDCAPGEVRFRYGPRGKPYLDLPAAPAFNLSDSGDLALLAVADLPALGLDIERCRPRRHLMEIAARMFPPSAVADLDGLAEDQRLDAFYGHWTRLEAVIKSHGGGLLDPKRDPTDNRPTASFRPHPGYLGCVAATVDLPPPPDWRCWRYDPTTG